MDKKRAKILVVDDENTVRALLKNLLTFKGAEVKTAEDGLKAIEAVGLEEFDLAFIDMRMPVMDGLQTLRVLRKINPRIKYVMMTGYALDERVEEAMRDGATCCLKKPFDLNEVTALIEKHLGGL